MGQRSLNIVLLPGDGIGPEVISAALRVIERAAVESDVALSFEEQLFGGAATDATGTPIPEKTLNACLDSDGILLGAVGGPKWDACAREERPEYGILSLRKALGSFANLRPVAVPDSLVEVSPLRSSVVSGTDILVVRELTGGIYYGEPRGRTDDRAYNTLHYSKSEISRITHVAFEWARRRNRNVISVDKSNVLEVYVLWREVVTEIHQQSYSDVVLRHMYVDNAAMQIIVNPSQFDVLLTGNMFGDILSDLASTLVGSLGMLPSACLGGTVGLFEPVHGSAPDIAGMNKANPIGAILSSAMLFEELNLVELAARIRKAVDQALSDGFRTPDILEDDSIEVGTIEMANVIADRLTEVAA